MLTDFGTAGPVNLTRRVPISVFKPPQNPRLENCPADLIPLDSRELDPLTHDQSSLGRPEPHLLLRRRCRVGRRSWRLAAAGRGGRSRARRERDRRGSGERNSRHARHCRALCKSGGGGGGQRRLSLLRVRGACAEEESSRRGGGTEETPRFRHFRTDRLGRDLNSGSISREKEDRAQLRRA